MDTQQESKLTFKKLMPRKLLLAGMPFFVAGALVATGINGTNPLRANDTVATEHNQVLESPAMPSSFAQLADQLSPSVVNVRVTKVMQTGFQGPQMHGNPFGDQFGDFFNRFFEQMPKSMPGSGKIINEKSRAKKPCFA